VIRRALTALAVLAMAGVSSVAYAHGDVRSTSPKVDASVDSPPREIRVTLTEAPTPDAIVQAKDGCGKQVVTTVSVAQATITGDVSGGAQPGRWTVSWRAISSVDGHPTEGKFSFLVNGATDCSSEGADPSPTSEATPDASVASPTADATHSAEHTPGPTESEVDLDAAPASEEEGGGFPAVPVAIGAVVIIGVAVIARFVGAR
jgi:copper resistance protein C